MQDRALKGVENKNEEVGDTNEGLRDDLLRRYPGNRRALRMPNLRAARVRPTT